MATGKFFRDFPDPEMVNKLVYSDLQETITLLNNEFFDELVVSGNKFFIRSGGVWKECQSFIKIGGVWKSFEPKVKVANQWK